MSFRSVINLSTVADHAIPILAIHDLIQRVQTAKASTTRNDCRERWETSGLPTWLSLQREGLEVGKEMLKIYHA